MKLTQENFNTLVNNLNHKMTRIESDIKWLKWLVCAICATNAMGVFF